MKFENTKVYNMKDALRGMRNPLASWDKSDTVEKVWKYDKNDKDLIQCVNYWLDSFHDDDFMLFDEFPTGDIFKEIEAMGIYNIDDKYGTALATFIGPNDMRLAQRLISGGSEHRKFMRQIFVSVDITAPLYWWKEFDTYKVGTVANSTSTMHKLASTPITMDCFEQDDVPLLYYPECLSHWDNIIKDLEFLRIRYSETSDKRYWKELIARLPSSWLQTRTITMNYENIRSIILQRENHKLTEWQQFRYWAKTLPYANKLIFYRLD